MRKVIFFLMLFLTLIKIVVFDLSQFLPLCGIAQSMLFVVVFLATVEKVFSVKNRISNTAFLVCSYLMISFYAITAYIVSLTQGSHFPYSVFVAIGLFNGGLLLPMVYIAIKQKATYMQFLFSLLAIGLFIMEYILIGITQISELCMAKVYFLACVGLIGMVVTYCFRAKIFNFVKNE